MILDSAGAGFEKVVDYALEASNPESQISAGYADRLERRRESAELRREVLYSLMAEGNDAGDDNLRPPLYDRIKKLSKDTGVTLQLIEAMDRLPHAGSPSWRGTDVNA
jgi:hypothetical protein